MGTPLETLYKRFQTKVDENLVNKESIIFALVDVAISRVYKTCRHSLEYALDDPEYDDNENVTNAYSGSFNDTLDSDELELLTLWMLYEWNRREHQYLVKQRRDVGTSDFNRLPGKKEQLQVVTSSMQIIRDDIDELKNSFYTYKYY